jgi:uncharacterized protein (DUF58 family)
MNYRRLAALLGVVTLGAGLAAIAAPGLVAFDPGRILVWGIGGLALVEALRVVQGRRHAELDEAETPAPELPAATPPPGEDLDTELERFLDTGGIYFGRSRLREGLRSAAVAVLTRYDVYSEAEAEAAIESGTWTDDLVAAAFLGGEGAPTLPVRSRIRSWFRRESPSERGVGHAVEAIAAVAGVTPRTDEESTDDAPDRGTLRAAAGHEATRTTVPGPDGDGEGDEFGGILSRASHPTGRWRGVSVVALVGVGVGLLVGEPAVLLAGVLGVGFAAYARSSALQPGSISVDRSLGTDRPEPGENVEVTVAVTNETNRPLADLRLVDGVPEALAVADGSPRLGTALRVGESTTFSYTVTARRGVHTFGPTLLVARDLPGTTEQERLLTAETTLTCVPPLRPLTEPVPLRERATRYVGRVETPSGGEGVEFYATRDYRRGDALNRIDWNRRARTGTLTTVEFREERSATVLLAVDARAGAYVSPEPYAPHAVDRSVEAAGRLFATLVDSGDRVGLTVLSPEECWLAPGSGVDHRVEARELLATHPALSPLPGDRHVAPTRWLRQLRKRLPSATQVVLLTPLHDDHGSLIARRFEEYGYPVTVLSPDPTADRTASHRLSRVSRAIRMSTLRSAGVRVIDWPSDRTVDEALARYDERWSR